MQVQVLTGTPAEIAEFLRLTEGDKTDSEADDLVVSGNAMSPGAVATFVEERGRGADTNARVLDYLERVRALGSVEIVTGTSARTKDGLTDYLMIRDDGIRRYGAVAYVKPANGGLTLRLTKDDVADVDPVRIKLRDVRPGHQYVVNCPLRDVETVRFAVELTIRALDKVRGSDSEA
ncbi:hypothetical protein [Streptomyces sp. NBC_01022]|uniref:hypothetical protein n=1 Tax=Streptomyces sp. NBC_01022 TaxID=2903723 RepID=UPI002DD978FD|nr:hypothetical protein [Streptomyces sp. NBC_01022]WRZ82663.1 hypothetical protein OG316_21565 [Streptomyces sp. NBC_01022]